LWELASISQEIGQFDSRIARDGICALTEARDRSFKLIRQAGSMCAPADESFVGALEESIGDIKRNFKPFMSSKLPCANTRWFIAKSAMNVFFVCVAAYGPEKAAACRNIARAFKNQIQSIHLFRSPTVSSTQHQTEGSERYWQGFITAIPYLIASSYLSFYRSSICPILSISAGSFVAAMCIAFDLWAIWQYYR
jgi:hypothetical protein